MIEQHVEQAASTPKPAKLEYSHFQDIEELKVWLQGRTLVLSGEKTSVGLRMLNIGVVMRDGQAIAVLTTERVASISDMTAVVSASLLDSKTQTWQFTGEVPVRMPFRIAVLIS